jgi:hypothetical protein
VQRNNGLLLNKVIDMVFKDVVASGFAAGLTLLLFFSPVAQAASACKGLASSSCSGKAGCVWVGGYTRKDNRKVSGYCRSKGGKNASTAKTNTKKASSSGDSGSRSEKASAGAKKTSSSSRNTKVTGKQSAKKSSGSKSKKKKTTSEKKSGAKSKSSGSKTKTKTQKAKNAS